MEEIRHQLIDSLSVYPIIYRALAPSQVVVWDFWTINSIIAKTFNRIHWGLGGATNFNEYQDVPGS